RRRRRRIPSRPAGPVRRTCATGPWGTGRRGRPPPRAGRFQLGRNRGPPRAACRGRRRDRSSGRAGSWSGLLVSWVTGQQQGFAIGLLAADFFQGFVQIAALPFEFFAVAGEHLGILPQLGVGAVAALVVQVDQGDDFSQLQPQPPPAQGELEPRAVARSVDAVAAFARRADDALIFVEADRARRDAEFAGKLGNRPGGLAHGKSAERRMESIPIMYDVYVNVKHEF